MLSFWCSFLFFFGGVEGGGVGGALIVLDFRETIVFVQCNLFLCTVCIYSIYVCVCVYVYCLTFFLQVYSFPLI